MALREIVLSLLLLVLMAACASAQDGSPRARRARTAGIGDWPMARGGSLRANRAAIVGRFHAAPQVAWRYSLGVAAGSVIAADLDEDGRVETYAAQNWRIVKHDPDGRVVWRSDRICRSFSLVAFEDLDGDGTREPLMLGTGLNSAAPLYFVFDPKTGRIRWRAELHPSNGGDARFGRILPERKGLQLVRALFPNPGGGELHLFCWDRGVEEGYELWSWTRHDDFIYFPQLAVGDVDGDGHNEILMLSQMCVWMFDPRTGSEIGRTSWGPRSRSYGGHFGLWHMKPGHSLSALIVSAYNKISVVDTEGGRPALRWDHVFEPGVGDTDLKGRVQFIPDGVCDLDGDGWTEVVCNEYAGNTDGKWRTVVLDARDGHVRAELAGKVLVGAADLDSSGRTVLFLRDRVNEHDAVSGPVQMARWVEGQGLRVVWTSSIETDLVREPGDPGLRLSRHPDEGERIKLANGTRSGTHALFLRASNGDVSALEPSSEALRSVAVSMPPDPPRPLVGLGAAPDRALDPPLVVDVDGDGAAEIVQRMPDGVCIALKPGGDGKAPAASGRLEGLLDDPVFADLDGDGRTEVIAVRNGPSEDQPSHLQPYIDARRTDGTLLWRRAWPAAHTYKHTPGKNGFAIMFMATGHFRDRKRRDVVVSYTGERSAGHTALLDGRTGATVWDMRELYPGMYGSCWDAYPPVVFDYNGDGLDDIATVCQTVHYTVLRGTDGHALLAKPRDASAQGFGGEPPLFTGGWAVGARLGAADVDGDGRPEMAVFNSQAAVGVLRASGEALWSLNLSVVEQVPSPGCWADVDGDGRPEAVFPFKDGFVRAYDGKSGALRWEENLGALGTLLAADVDGDGRDEILVSSEKGQLYCLGDRPDPTTGSHIRWTMELDGTPGQAVFARVGREREARILLPVSDGYLYCLKASAAR